ncbi:Senescence domain-containing protein [Plasmodiophora brassicae]
MTLFRPHSLLSLVLLVMILGPSLTVYATPAAMLGYFSGSTKVMNAGERTVKQAASDGKAFADHAEKAAGTLLDASTAATKSLSTMIEPGCDALVQITHNVDKGVTHVAEATKSISTDVTGTVSNLGTKAIDGTSGFACNWIDSRSHLKQQEAIQDANLLRAKLNVATTATTTAVDSLEKKFDTDVKKKAYDATIGLCTTASECLVGMTSTNLKSQEQIKALKAKTKEKEHWAMTDDTLQGLEETKAVASAKWMVEKTLDNERKAKLESEQKEHQRRMDEEERRKELALQQTKMGLAAAGGSALALGLGAWALKPVKPDTLFAVKPSTASSAMKLGAVAAAGVGLATMFARSHDERRKRMEDTQKASKAKQSSLPVATIVSCVIAGCVLFAGVVAGVVVYNKRTGSQTQPSSTTLMF